MTDRIDSELGPILIATTATHLVALDFAEFDARMKDVLQHRFGDIELRDSENPLGVSSRLSAYLAGELDALDEIEVDPGGTEFQQVVWRELRRIPIGKTISYGQLAVRVGQPTASRAVGMANSKNPIGIVIPCHRVIGADGTLTGYAGGIVRKQWLLAHEQVSGQLQLNL